MTVTGAILAGGRSARLSGRPKALLPIGPGGVTLLEGAIALVSAIAAPVFVCAREPGDYASLVPPGVSVLTDEVPDSHRGAPAGRPALGPLAGLAAALAASPHDRVLVVACDMPSLSRPLLERLIVLSHEHAGATAVVPRTARGLHPLHAVYRRSLLPEIQARIERRALALHDLLAATPTLEVAEDELRRYDPDLMSLANVNTPEDLARAIGVEAARRLLSTEQGSTEPG